MSNLTDVEKRYLEKLLGMGGGYVLDYTNDTFGTLFKRYSIDIHDKKYQTYGFSKAKKMRAFWEQESDDLVGKVLSEMLESYQAYCEINDQDIDENSFKKAQSIVNRLMGEFATTQVSSAVNAFLQSEFTIPDIKKLPIEAQIIPIIENRLNEVKITLKHEAYLSAIFLCGSILEAILLGAAKKNPKQFNQASASPKDSNGKDKPFEKWKLSQFIDVACEVGLLKPDVKQFSHGLRDFRNYIHPHKEIESEFTPDKHTAEVCFQVLKAALASVAGERDN